MMGNQIAEAIYSNTTEDGFDRNLTLCEILDHFVSRTHVKRRSTQGWSLLVRWTDGSESVVQLYDLKESFPVQVAQYAQENGLDKEDGFSHWVSNTLKKSNRLIGKIKSRLTKSQKYGVDVPRSVKEALEFDRSSGTSYWAQAIQKELKNLEVGFDVFPEGESAPQEYQFILCQFILDVKFDGTRNKEISTYGAEFCATRLCLEAIEGLRYKLRMFGIPFSGPTMLFGDNQSVIHNITRPDLTLKRSIMPLYFINVGKRQQPIWSHINRWKVKKTQPIF